MQILMIPNRLMLKVRKRLQIKRNQRSVDIMTGDTVNTMTSANSHISRESVMDISRRENVMRKDVAKDILNHVNGIKAMVDVNEAWTVSIFIRRGKMIYQRM